MKVKNVCLILSLVLTICISSRQVVKAGPSATSSSSGGALIKGSVRFTGTAPATKPISMSADPSCARQHSAPVGFREVIADSNGGLQNAVVFIAEGLGDRSFDVPKDPVVISQKGCLYLPHVLAMRANQPLEVVNSDPTAHNIHPTPANNREWNKVELPGGKMEEAFPREEISIPVKCNIHPWMHGYIAVFKHPYFVVTGEDGSFDLPSLPPGTYTVSAWHEKLGTSSQTITIGANETKQLSFVFKSM